jgi:hypothetical protein
MLESEQPRRRNPEALVALRAGSTVAADCLERLVVDAGFPRPVRPGQSRRADR